MLNSVELIARLLHDVSLRERFAVSRSEFLRSFNLSPADRETLMRLDLQELQMQADALIRKRASEVSKLIPETWNTLGRTAPMAFGDYVATSPWPTGHRKHLIDAARFCDFLGRQQPPGETRSEWDWIRFVADDHCWAVCVDHRRMIRDRRHLAIHFFYRRGGVPRRMSFLTPTPCLTFFKKDSP